MIKELYDATVKHKSDATMCSLYYAYNNEIIWNDDTKGQLITEFRDDKINQFIQMFIVKYNSKFEPYFLIGQPFATLYKTDIIIKNNVKFPVKMQYKEDVIFNLYFAQNSRCIIRINKPLYYYNKANTKSLTSQLLYTDSMLPKIKRDLDERYKFYTSKRTNDHIFLDGLHQYTVRCFLYGIAKACVNENKGFSTYESIYHNKLVLDAFKHSGIKYFNFKENFAIWLIKHNLRWIYYYSVKLYIKSTRKL